MSTSTRTILAGLVGAAAASLTLGLLLLPWHSESEPPLLPHRERRAVLPVPEADPRRVSAIGAEELREAQAEILRLEAEVERLRALLAARAAQAVETRAREGEQTAAAARVALEKALAGGGLLGASGTPLFRLKVAELRAALGDEGLDTLIAALTSTSTQERLHAALLLEGWNDPRSLAHLELAVTSDRDGMVQRYAAYALARIEGDEQIPVLQRIAADPAKEPGARINAAYGLAERGEDDGARLLIEMLRSKDTPADLRGEIGPVLTMVAPAVSPAVVLPYFHESLQPDQTQDRAFLALKALGGCGDHSSLPHLEALLASGRPDSLKEEARRVINRIAGYQKYQVD